MTTWGCTNAMPNGSKVLQVAMLPPSPSPMTYASNSQASSMA
ncbi:MAG: hypothetical protein Q4D25_09300 [Bacteroidales bacterium]|nr:hypothetical protein [Bacteroidales bacterium]